jgi:ATP-binding cassette subfamily B protein
LTVASAALLALPIGVRRAMDAGLAEPQAIERHFIALFAVAIVFAACVAVRHYLVSWLGERVVSDLRGAVYRHVLGLGPGFFERTPTGEVLSRLTADTTLIQSLVGSSISVAVRSAIMLVGGLVFMTVTSPPLAGLVLVLVPLALAPLIALGRRARRLSRLCQDRIAAAGALAAETLNGISTVQSLGLVTWFGRRMDESVGLAFDAARARFRNRATLAALALVGVAGAMLFVVFVGAEAVLAGRMSSGELSQFVMYAGIVALSAAALSEVFGDVQHTAGAMERLMELLHVRSEVQVPAHPLPLPHPTRGRIAFEGVSFRYPSRPEPAALRAFDLILEPGETVALVGPSGAGKTTVFRLLLRFHDTHAGRISLDGLDIARAHPDAVRERIGSVPQEPVIFAADALENIRLGRIDAGDEEVLAAARAALADEFLSPLPEGYRTFLGERGLRLSVGQRQRIAIARAILKDPPVLLLDEATSALDAESERLVQEALTRLMRGRTTLVIAHRLATVREADRIVVMDRGAIVAIGAHAALMRQGGLYARLAALQFGEIDGPRQGTAVQA